MYAGCKQSYMTKRQVLGLLGMPGAGKTTALNALESWSDCNFVGLQMKTIAAEQFNQMQNVGMNSFPQKMEYKIREEDLVEEATPEGDLGEKIASWVDTILSVNNSYFAEKATERIQNTDNADVAVVDGIRSVPDAEYIMDSFEEFNLLFLHTPFSTRLDRLKQRSRSGEEDVDTEYLINRDKQELNWGVDEILSSYQKDGLYQKEYPVDFFYANHESVSEFEREFRLFVDDLLELD